MSRMLDALKNLEAEPIGATIVVPIAPVSPMAPVSPAAVPADLSRTLPVGALAPRPVAPPVPGPAAPARTPPSGASVGASFMATLAATAAPSVSAPSPVPPAAPPISAPLVDSAPAAYVPAQAAAPAPAAAAPIVLNPPLATAPPSTVRPPQPPAPAVAASNPQPVPPPALAKLSPPPAPAKPPSTPPSSSPQAIAAPPAIAPQVAPPAPADLDLPPPRSEATRLEQAVKAALADPRRSAPLEQLVRRMRAELRADCGRCWLLADVGQHTDSSDLAAHLGAVFAGQLGDTLLIDANVAEASLSIGLGAAGRPGVAQLTSSSKQWQSFVQPTAWPHLFLLPAGQALTSTVEAPDQWAALLSQAERRFRLVLIDGGAAAEPLCAALSRVCDATYLVIRLGVTEAQQARTALQQFRSRGARVLGSIATSVPSV